MLAVPNQIFADTQEDTPPSVIGDFYTLEEHLATAPSFPEGPLILEVLRARAKDITTTTIEPSVDDLPLINKVAEFTDLIINLLQSQNVFADKVAEIASHELYSKFQQAFMTEQDIEKFTKITARASSSRSQGHYTEGVTLRQIITNKQLKNSRGFNLDSVITRWSWETLLRDPIPSRIHNILASWDKYATVTQALVLRALVAYCRTLMALQQLQYKGEATEYARAQIYMLLLSPSMDELQNIDIGQAIFEMYVTYHKYINATSLEQQVFENLRHSDITPSEITGNIERLGFDIRGVTPKFLQKGLGSIERIYPSKILIAIEKVFYFLGNKKKIDEIAFKTYPYFGHTCEEPVRTTGFLGINNPCIVLLDPDTYKLCPVGNTANNILTKNPVNSSRLASNFTKAAEKMQLPDNIIVLHLSTPKPYRVPVLMRITGRFSIELCIPISKQATNSLLNMYGCSLNSSLARLTGLHSAFTNLQDVPSREVVMDCLGRAQSSNPGTGNRSSQAGMPLIHIQTMGTVDDLYPDAHSLRAISHRVESIYNLIAVPPVPLPENAFAKDNLFATFEMMLRLTTRVPHIFQKLSELIPLGGR